MVSVKVWAPCRIYTMQLPLWQAESQQRHGLFTTIFWKDQVVPIPRVFNAQTHLIHILPEVPKPSIPTLLR